MLTLHLPLASLFGLHTPPRGALLLTLAFIVFLVRRDIKEKPDVSGALWLPVLWLVLICSRSFTQWLNIFGLHVSGPVSMEEGSPVDAWFIFALIMVGVCVLLIRQVSLSEVVLKNGWLIIFVAYCFISILWSDFPLVSFKRWIKMFGHPIMALIILTEPNLEEALIQVMKRCTYVIVPVSILFIKYFPDWGVRYDAWSGAPMFIGVSVGKNGLGSDCLIFGFFFFWYLLQIWRTERSTRRRNELRLIAVFLLMIGWLFWKSHSATSIICFFVGIMVVVLLGMRSVNKKFIGTYMLAALVLIVAAELEFGISAHVSEALGRGSELSGRTKIWAAVLKMDTDPIFGTGFESFWLGDRPEQLEDVFATSSGQTVLALNEAHNGYLEVYLNLGLVGLLLVIAMLIAAYRKMGHELFRNFEWGRYRLGFFVAVLLYNCTEAAFRILNPILLVFYITAIDYPRTYFTRTQQPLESGRLDEEPAYAEREP
jgi:exopolysaccharide production protein ExoQ